MTETDRIDKLTAKQVIVRVIAMLSCGVGVATCVYSLSMQVIELGNIFASVCWFSGLFAVVLSISAYVVTCGPGYKNRVPLAVVVVALVAVAVFVLERNYAFMWLVIGIALGVVALNVLVLVIYHFLLKREDPLAL